MLIELGHPNEPLEAQPLSQRCTSHQEPFSPSEGTRISRASSSLRVSTRYRGCPRVCTESQLAKGTSTSRYGATSLLPEPSSVEPPFPTAGGCSAQTSARTKRCVSSLVKATSTRAVSGRCVRLRAITQLGCSSTQPSPLVDRVKSSSTGAR